MFDERYSQLIFPIRIPTPFAVGDVFCYLIKDRKNVLVDCGQKQEVSFQALRKGLRERGLTVSDIDEVWLTHGHPDHCGQAARVAEKSGATVYGHPKERANFMVENDRTAYTRFFSRRGIPDAVINRMIERLEWIRRYQEPVTPERIEEGDRLTSGTLSFEVWHSPGHSVGHIILVEREGLIFGGDLLLKHISTNALISFDPDTGERCNSLGQYRDSLMRLGDFRNGSLLLPGHGMAIRQIRTTARGYLEEHETRYRKVLSRLRDRQWLLPALGRELFPDAVQRGDLFLVLSEVIGYLDWGIENGQIQAEPDNNGVYHYTAG